MKITNIQILEILNFLQKFEEKTYPQKISYGILKNLQILSKEQEIYNKAMQKILKAYSDKTEKDENGSEKTELNGLPVIQEEFREEFYQEVNDLLLMEVEITPFYVHEEIFDYENPNGRYDTISPKDMLMLISILCAPEDEGKKDIIE